MKGLNNLTDKLKYTKMEIKHLSIADLKAALDFVTIELNELKREADNKRISPDKIPAYNEVKKTENDLYQRLLNITRSLV